jgi:hypothetical protein
MFIWLENNLLEKKNISGKNILMVCLIHWCDTQWQWFSIELKGIRWLWQSHGAVESSGW